MADSIRKITNYGRRNVGKFASVKMRQMFWYESFYERDFLYLLDLDPDVVAFRTQCLRLRFHADGRDRVYHPDVEVLRRSGKEIVEVKPEKFARSLKYEYLFRTVTPLFAEYGYDFRVVTEELIYQQPRLQNAKLLHRYGRTAIPDDAQVACAELLGSGRPRALGEVMEFLRRRKYGIDVLYAILFHGILDVDLSVPLGMDSQVRFLGTTRHDVETKGP